MYIIYSADGNYGYACESSIDSGGHDHTKGTYLGRVLDKSRHIFKNRERGVFTFDPETGQYGTVPEDFIPPVFMDKRRHRTISLDFGDGFFVDSFLYASGMWGVIDCIPFKNRDTLHAMVIFYVLSKYAGCDAITWYEGNVVSLLYPNADMDGQRISDFLKSVGRPGIEQIYQEKWAHFVLENYDPDRNILIDSTDLPNAGHNSYTFTSIHNNIKSVAARLAMVVQRSSGIPLFFRLFHGNIIDENTLGRLLQHLAAMHIQVDSVLIDAGYDDKENLDLFYNEKHICTIDYVTRADAKNADLKQMIADCLPTIEKEENLVRYGDRLLYIVRKKIYVGEKGNNPAWMYLALDLGAQTSEDYKLLIRMAEDNENPLEITKKMKGAGVFGMISGREYAPEAILPTYYMRQYVEQAFDDLKNYTRMLPIRVDDDETLQGHVLMSYIACCVVKMIQLGIEGDDFRYARGMGTLRNEKCTVYKDRIVTDPASRDGSRMYRAFNLDCPDAIKIVDGRLEYTHPQAGSLPKRRKKRSTKIASNPYADKLREEAKAEAEGRKNQTEPESASERSVKDTSKENEKANTQASQTDMSDENNALASDMETVTTALAKAVVQPEAQIRTGRTKPKGYHGGRKPGSRNKKTLAREAYEREHPPVPKKRGRPKGSLNKKTLEHMALIEELKRSGKWVPPVPKKRGRPKGSLNKKTLARLAEQAKLTKDENAKPGAGSGRYT